MNLADAIRQAAAHAKEDKVEMSENSFPDNPERHMPAVETLAADSPKTDPVIELNAFDAITSEPVHIPEPPTICSPSVVRLELFLSPEQLRGLFNAVVASQHTMMTLREAATYLRTNPSTLEQLAQEGQIPALQIDGRWRFPKSGIDEWVALQSYQREEESNVA